jgi:hypothetical protein
LTRQLQLDLIILLMAGMSLTTGERAVDGEFPQLCRAAPAALCPAAAAAVMPVAVVAATNGVVSLLQAESRFIQALTATQLMLLVVLLQEELLLLLLAQYL